MFLRHQKIYMNEVERQIRLDEKQKPNSNTSCKESCKKKPWSLSNKEILHQRLLRRVLIRTLDFGIDFAIWSNLEDNYLCDTREKIGHAGGESERKTWPRRTVNWIPILPSTYKYKGSNSLQTNVREKEKKSRIKIKAQGNKLETWPGFIIMNFIKKKLF